MASEYVDYIVGQLQEAGEIRARKMFGGVGIYVDEVFCAIIGPAGRFYLRVGPDNLPDFERAGMKQFPGGKGKGMPYYEVPEHVLEDSSELKEWAAKARRAAVAAKK